MGKKLIDYLHLYLKSPFLVIPQYQSDRKSLIAYIKQLPLSGTEIEFVEEDNEVPAFYAFLPDVKPILPFRYNRGRKGGDEIKPIPVQ